LAPRLGDAEAASADATHNQEKGKGRARQKGCADAWQAINGGYPQKTGSADH